MEADIQGAGVYAFLPPPSSQGIVVGAATIGIPRQKWERTCRR